MAQVAAQRLSLHAERLGTLLPQVGAWTLGFVPVSVLAFEGGGYDPIVRSQVGIAVWWILVLGCLVGAITPTLPTRRALAAAGLLAALGVWSWIGIAASESPERTLGEVARIATYLGVLLLGLMTLDRRRASTALLGVTSAIVLVAGLAVLSRLQPGHLPANETGAFLDIAQHRLNWPLNYWNGLAAFGALGVPLALAFAAGHRSVAVRAVSAAALPVIALCISLTFSRGGIAAAAVGVIVLALAAPIRARILASASVGAVASAILVASAAQRGLVHEDLRGSTALEQADELTVVMLVVVAGAGLLQAGIAYLEPSLSPMRMPRVRLSRSAVRTSAAVAICVAVGLVLAAGAPGRAADAWHQFKSPALQEQIANSNDASRLTSLSSNGRYQLWNVAIDAMAAHPLVGSGAGSYEFTWLREKAIGGTVRDAHSFYLELGAETGVLGLLLALGLVGALLSPFAGLRRAAPRPRLTVAAALAGLCAFLLSAALDWVWELPAIAITAMLLAAVAFTAQREGSERKGEPRMRGFVLALTALLAIGVLAVVLANESAVEQSRASARAGSLPAALAHAQDAHAVLATAATPLLQSALVREQGGDVRGAAADARKAVLREPKNWRTWLVLSRLEARAGRPGPAVAAFRRARALNPLHPVFAR